MNHIEIAGIAYRRTQTLHEPDRRLLEEELRHWLSLRGYTFQGTLTIVERPSGPMLA